MPATTGIATGTFGGVQRHRTTRGVSNLPQTATAAIFTITGTVKLWDVELEVTTITQVQLNNLKLVATPTIGSATDLTAVTDSTTSAVGTHYNATGTFAGALVKSANGAHVAQAVPIVVTAGTVGLSASASSTGQYKAAVLWEPLTVDGNVTATAVT